MPEATPAGDAIGLIAGNGQLPLLFALAARARGVRVAAVGLHGETCPELRHGVDSLDWVHVGQVGGMLRHLRAAGVDRAAMAGGIDKRRLFHRARPDWLGLRLLARAALRRDDGILRAVATVCEAGGVRIVPSTIYMPEALAPPGVLTVRQPSRQQWRDLAFGLQAARHIGALDVGQTVVLRDGAVVAIEAIEGTDACIARGAALSGHRSVVVVKAAKPNQDMRFDVPTVGPATLATMKQAGVVVLGVEAHRTLLLEPQNLVRAADAMHLCIVGLQASAP